MPYIELSNTLKANWIEHISGNSFNYQMLVVSMYGAVVLLDMPAAEVCHAEAATVLVFDLHTAVLRGVG